MTSAREPGLGPLVLMAASGFAGLGYQIVWTEQCSLWLGHESMAVLAVVTAFFGGLALGGLVLGSRIERSLHPVRWYAGCELVVALWSVLLFFAWGPWSAWAQRATGVAPSLGRQWTVAFGGSLLLFLPATAAMGATLPAMERLTGALRERRRSISALYASNTFGAVLGVLALAFWLVPAFGLARSAALCGVLNLACALSALRVFPKTVARSPAPKRIARSSVRGVLGRFAVTGLLGIGYEVVVVRVLSQVTEDTVYTFALLLAVYLLGSAAGAAGYSRWLERRVEREELGDWLLAALSAACLAGAASLWAAEHMRAWALDAFGGSAAGAIAAEAVLAVAAFGLPTLVMGALFSHFSRMSSAAGVTFGRALGVNLLAAALAPVLFGVVLIPLFGSKSALLAIVFGYLALAAPHAWRTRPVWIPALAALAVALLAPPLSFVEVPEGGHVVSYEEGVMAAVSVVEDSAGVARLRINNRQQEGSSATLRVDARQAWLPLLFHPAPRSALFLGLGTGVTASSAAEDKTLAVDAVELLPEVIAASAHFTHDAADGGARKPNLKVVSADARRYVRASDRRYDVIVSDNFHPARSGSGALYTVEHFQAVHLRLAAGGVFCQWLPLHQLDLETLRSIVRSFLIAYPRAWAVLASGSLETPVIGLVARADGSRFDMAALRERLSRVTLRDWLAGLGLEDEYAVLGGVIAGPEALERFAGSAAANTDDHPVVTYAAPRVTYAPDSTPRDRLLTLLGQVSLAPDALIFPTLDPISSRRLAAYWLARDRFIEAGRNVRPAAGAREMLAQVREPLLSVLRISPDFRPAYDPLLAMATSLARSDGSAARALLSELAELQPARTEASQVLARFVDAAASVDTTQR